MKIDINLEDRACLICGKNFSPKRRKSVCCSKSCQEKRWRTEHHDRYVQNRKLYSKTPEAIAIRKEWRHANASRCTSIKNKYLDAHPGQRLKALEYQRKYHQRKKEERKQERERRYKTNHSIDAKKSLTCKQKINKRHKEKMRHGGIKQKLIQENGLVCSRCGIEGGSSDIVGHHVNGNPKDHDHQELVCRSCHVKKHGLGLDVGRYAITI